MTISGVKADSFGDLLGRRAPVNLSEDLLDHPEPGLGASRFQRRLAIKGPEPLPEPCSGLVAVAENILGEGLNLGEANQ